MKSFLKPTLLALVVVLSLPTAAIASSGAAQEKALSTLSNNQKITSLTQQELSRIIAGVQNFYVKNTGAWPSSLNDINAYYTGDFRTPVGLVTGAQSASGYVLTINANNADNKLRVLLTSMAAKYRGQMVGSVLTFNIQSPNQSAATMGVISRFADVEGAGERNKMHTSLNMNSFDVSNIKTLNTQSATITNATISTANISTASVTDATIGTQTVTNHVVNNLVVDSANYTTANAQQFNASNLTTNSTLNTAAVIAGGKLVANGSGKLYYQNQDIDARYLGITDTAADADKLGGVDATEYLRTDLSNAFNTVQTFDGGMTIGGDLNAGSVSATNMNVMGDISARNVYGRQNVRIGGKWLSTTFSEQSANTNDINAINSKIPSGVALGRF